MISAAVVKELRERTGAGMMDCKRALEQTNGDMDKAIELLREKGLAAAAKKAGRAANQGAVYGYITSNGQVGSLIEVNCETDFVAKNDDFQAMVHDLGQQVAEGGASSVEELLAQPMKGQSVTVQDALTNKIATLGENMGIRRLARYEAGTNGLLDVYIHLGGRIGVLMHLAADKPEVLTTDAVKSLAHDLCLQVVASKPQHVSRNDVAAEIVAKEKEIYKVQAMNEGKPEHIAEKMVSGRLEKFFQEICLMEQLFIRDTDITVTKLLANVGKEVGANLTVKEFARFELGEGIGTSETAE
ncbi:MAG: translation elongation factor Ts [Bacillota bacterium]